VAAVLVSALPVVAQTAREGPDLANWFTGLRAVSGYENTFALVLEDLVPGAERDRAGGVVARSDWIRAIVEAW